MYCSFLILNQFLIDFSSWNNYRYLIHLFSLFICQISSMWTINQSIDGPKTIRNRTGKHTKTGPSKDRLQIFLLVIYIAHSTQTVFHRFNCSSKLLHPPAFKNINSQTRNFFFVCQNYNFNIMYIPIFPNNLRYPFGTPLDNIQ